jgi:hypothetical protein
LIVIEDLTTELFGAAAGVAFDGGHRKKRGGLRLGGKQGFDFTAQSVVICAGLVEKRRAFRLRQRQRLMVDRFKPFETANTAFAFTNHLQPFLLA